MNRKNFISWLGSGYAVLDITKIARIITKENTISILCFKGCLPLHYREINLNVLLFNEMDGDSVAFNKHSMYVELLHHINDVRTTNLSSLA